MNIEMKGINKSFGSNQVLKDAGFYLSDFMSKLSGED